MLLLHQLELIKDPVAFILGVKAIYLSKHNHYLMLKDQEFLILYKHHRFNFLKQYLINI